MSLNTRMSSEKRTDMDACLRRNDGKEMRRVRYSAPALATLASNEGGQFYGRGYTGEDNSTQHQDKGKWVMGTPAAREKPDPKGEADSRADAGSS